MLSTIIAYGGFSGDSFDDCLKILAIVIPNFIIVWGGGLTVYILSKRSIRFMVYSILAYIFFLGLYIPRPVMGAYGPNHVAAEMSVRNAVASMFFVLLIPLFEYIRRKRHHIKEADPGGSA